MQEIADFFRDLPKEEIDFIKEIEDDTYIIGGEYKARLAVLYVMYDSARGHEWIIIDKKDTALNTLKPYAKYIINDDYAYDYVVIEHGRDSMKYRFAVTVTPHARSFKLDEYYGVLFINTEIIRTFSHKIIVEYLKTHYMDEKLINRPVCPVHLDK